MTEVVLYEVDGAVATLTLNRPERANTITLELRTELQRLALQAANDPAVRVLIVTGAGRHFCGGADLNAPRAALTDIRQPNDPVLGLDWVPKPVIAAINGAAMGGGCEIALGCDFRYISATAKIGLTEIRFGALPMGGGTARLPRLIGIAAARRLIMVGDPIEASEALEIRLVDKVCAPEELLADARAFALKLASRAPYAMRVAKRLMNETLDHDLAAALRMEVDLVSKMATPEERQAARDEAAANSATYAGIFSKKA